MSMCCRSICLYSTLSVNRGLLVMGVTYPQIAPKTPKGSDPLRLVEGQRAQNDVRFRAPAQERPMWMWSLCASVRSTFLRRFPLSVKQTE